MNILKIERVEKKRGDRGRCILKLNIEELKELEIEMEENEAVMKEMWLSLGTEHEDAGDRV